MTCEPLHAAAADCQPSGQGVTFSVFDNLSMLVGCQSLLLQLALLFTERLLCHLAGFGR